MEKTFTRMSSHAVGELIKVLAAQGFKGFHTVRERKGRWVVRAFK